MRLKSIFALFLFISFSVLSSAQSITASDRRKLAAKEDSLKHYAYNFTMDSVTANRMIYDSLFTRILVRALQVKNSFYYPFDSLIGISKIYAPDTSFRIFTWNISFNDYYSRQKGAIQMRTADGSLKLFPLRDDSEFTSNPEDSVRSRNSWIGAVYYNIIKTQYKGKNYYTLFGFDNNNAMSSMKWIDVLTFDSKDEPYFGGPFFSYAEDSVKKPTRFRYSIEFKKDTRVLVNYISDLSLILVDHLISESDEPDHKWTYVPDGDNEGFKWEKGQWVHVNKVFNFKLKDGEAPVDDPLLDIKGNRDEKKLQESSDKNKAKQKNDENN